MPTAAAGVPPRLGAVGFVSPTRTVEWGSAQTLLYAVAVGAGPDELALVTENSAGVTQRAVPSYAALIGTPAAEVRDAVGEAWDPIRLVYAGQRLTWHRELPPEGSADVRSEIVAITDKGSGALVEVDTTARDAATGDPLFTAGRRVFLRGAGGFDGSRAAATRSAAPERDDGAPDDLVVHHRLPANQAVLYRLTGDRHPLHSDPVFARRAGFDRPILHGMCTYGVTTMLLLRHVCDGDPGRLRELDSSFRSPVWPGDELELLVHHVSPGRVRFRVLRVGSDRPALDDGLLRFDESPDT